MRAGLEPDGKAHPALEIVGASDNTPPDLKLLRTFPKYARTGQETGDVPQ